MTKPADSCIMLETMATDPVGSTWNRPPRGGLLRLNSGRFRQCGGCRGLESYLKGSIYLPQPLSVRNAIIAGTA